MKGAPERSTHEVLGLNISQGMGYYASDYPWFSSVSTGNFYNSTSRQVTVASFQIIYPLDSSCYSMEHNRICEIKKYSKMSLLGRCAV
jgi:hypothetical protein